MGNRVFLNADNVIEIEVVGDQDVASIEHMARQADAYLTELKALGKPCLVLDNLLQMGNVDAEGRKKVVELAKQLDYDRLALLGKEGGVMRFGTNLMLRATGKGYKLRFFDDRTQAMNWLYQK